MANQFLGSVRMAVQTKTASYTAQRGDGNTTFIMSSSSGTTFTIPNDTAVNFPISTKITIVRDGTGDVTINTPSNTFRLSIRYASCDVVKVAANTWLFQGENLAAPALLLDTYTNAAVAYSLRQLRTGVTSVVRVRRSNDNAEANFTAAEVTNGTLTGWTGANDGFVTRLYKQIASGGTDAVQATSSLQPQIVSSGSLMLVNGKPAMYGDATKYLTFTPTTTSGYAAKTTFIVAVINETNSITRGLYCNSFDTLNEWTCIKGNASNAINFRAEISSVQKGSPLGIININNQFIIDGLYNGGNVSNYIDNVLSTLVTAGTINDSGGAIMARNSSGAAPWLGYFQEVVDFNSDETSNRTAIRTAINDYYNAY